MASKVKFQPVGFFLCFWFFVENPFTASQFVNFVLAQFKISINRLNQEKNNCDQYVSVLYVTIARKMIHDAEQNLTL